MLSVSSDEECMLFVVYMYLSICLVRVRRLFLSPALAKIDGNLDQGCPDRRGSRSGAPEGFLELWV